MNGTQQWPQQQWKEWIQLLLGLSLTILFFYMMAPFLVAMLIGAVGAIILFPIHHRLSAYLPKAFSALLLTCSLAIGALIPIFFIMYGGALKIQDLSHKVKMPSSESLDSWLHHPRLTSILAWAPVDTVWLKDQSFEMLQVLAERLTRLMGAFIGGMPGLLLAYTIVMITLYFFLLDGIRLLRFLAGLSPLNADRSASLFLAFQNSCRGVVLSLILSALIQSFLMVVLFLSTRIPDPFLWGGVTFIMGMVPVVGSAPIWVGGALFHLLNGHIVAMIILIVGGIIVSLSDNIVRIYVMKGQSEMHPLLALVSVFGAVNLIGPTGIFLGPVIAAVFVSFLKIVAVEVRREKQAST